ncbi:hypothetical protein NQ314_009527 [Rhamnusium bicolor]|uniref:K Homology domain-containing protein n=1 Tax=Rhamnusium bicolor TaxID=1586634 RepID=A0AAV8Y1V2_9CUCU|nr:hypothetical protein NQ314_009527 [Rhamnusium bicolor]
MCDDWDDSAVVAPNYSYESRPIQTQTFGNSGFRGGGRGGGGRGRGGGFNRNNDRDRRFNRNDNAYDGFQRNSDGPPNNSFNRNDRGMGQFNRNSRGGAGGGNNRPFGDNWNRTSSDVSEVLNVPSRFVGRIIGRGGSKINELQTESGARIQVTKDTDGDDTVVKIFGDQKAVAKAKALISEITTDTIQVIEAKDIPHQEQRKPAIVDWQSFLKECVSNININSQVPALCTPRVYIGL